MDKKSYNEKIRKESMIYIIINHINKVMFYKLKREGNCYSINNELGKKNFAALDYFSKEEIDAVFDFAYKMTFGKEGEHKGIRTGGTHDRCMGGKFADTFQGKLGELAVFKQASKLGLNPSALDYTVGGLGYWDHMDMTINGRNVSIKSTKERGQLLLLETGDWDNEGNYRHAKDENGSVVPVSYDFNIFARISPVCEYILKDNNLFESNDVSYDQLRAVVGDDWAYDIPGFITKEDLCDLIADGYILPKNSYLSLNGKKYTRMDAENYYVRAADMHSLSQLPEYILKRKYKITIAETWSFVFDIAADNFDEALATAKRVYKNGELNFESGDVVSRKLMCESVDTDEKTDWIEF